MDITNTIFTVLAFVIIFIFAIQKFSRHIEEAAGDHLKTLLERWTKTPVRGAVTGMLLSSIMQSGNASTLITVSLVNAGLVTFVSALGVVIGINLGTVITAQLIALNMTYIAPLVVIASFIVSHTHSRFQKYGKVIFYFGLMFLCLLAVTSLITPLQHNAYVVSFLRNNSSIYETLIIGAIATAVLQSGSAVVGLSIILGGSGLLSLTQILGFILGTSIGGPAAVIFVSMHASREAKKVAVAQILYNLLLVVIFLPIISPFESLLHFITPHLTQQAVNAEFIFNMVTTIICLALIKPFARLVSQTTRKLL